MRLSAWLPWGVLSSARLYQAVEAFKDAPDEFLALSNEIADFRLILNTVERALQHNLTPPAPLVSVDLETLVLRSNATLNRRLMLSSQRSEELSLGPDGAEAQMGDPQPSKPSRCRKG